jgi:glycine betaine/choline ABC-type transport system substrate-binding protein
MLATLFAIAASAAYVITTIILTPPKKPKVKKITMVIGSEPTRETTVFTEIMKAWSIHNEWTIANYYVETERISW